MTSKLRQAIVKTLAYADIFDYPLTEEEMQRRLIKLKVKSEKLKVARLDSAKRAIKNSKVISERDGYYFLYGRNKLVGLRRKRKKYSEGKLKKAQKIASFLKIIPTIKLIGISGALAVENVKEGDDIDFFIISSKNRIWMTRFLTIVLLELLGKRRRPKEKNITDKVCLNMFIDESHLALPLKGQNLYTAYEVIQMKPLWERNKTYRKFLAANSWVRKYLPNSIRITNYELRITDEIEEKKNILNYLEFFLKIFQLWYMKSRRSKEVVSDHIIRFHPQDAKAWVLRKYRERISSLSI